jgi:thiamine biosynthesis lipoprotein
MNPGSQLAGAMEALEVVHEVERRLTVYRDDSEVSRLNATAAARPAAVSAELFELLTLCEELMRLTEGAFDVATQTQILLWRRCRAEERLPTDEEVEAALACSGMEHVRLDRERGTVEFEREGVGLNFGAIGKGWALDRCVERVERRETRVGETRVGETRVESRESRDARPDGVARSGLSTLDSYCLHGGHSSVVARGGRNGLAGWPVGIGNPLFTTPRLGTILLADRAIGTSGSNVQFYRYEGKLYGHILNPRTGRPAEELLSATVLAPTAAMADALSTAFFVLGVEKARAICDNCPLIGALLIPPPSRGGRLEPVAVGLPDDILFLDPEQVVVGAG